MTAEAIAGAEAKGRVRARMTEGETEMEMRRRPITVDLQGLRVMARRRRAAPAAPAA